MALLYRYLITTLLIVTTAQVVVSQKQLILLKGEKVILRLRPGEEFVYKLKNSKTVRRSYVNNLSDTAVVTHKDTVTFRTIERIYFRRSTFVNYAGSFLIAGGMLLFLGDQINVTLVQGDKPNLDKGVSIASLAFIGVGIPMVMIRKKSQRLGYKFRLMTINKESVFYEPDPEGFESPFIPN